MQMIKLRSLVFIKQAIKQGAIKHALLCSIAMLLAHTNLYALNVGDIQLESRLGAPLLAKVPLINVKNLSKEEIHIKQASLDTYESLGVDRSALYKTLLFDIDKNHVVTISSKSPIKEPYLHFVIQLRWPQGELFREVKLLLDPPANVN